jgi:hypothetical protein
VPHELMRVCHQYRRAMLRCGDQYTTVASVIAWVVLAASKGRPASAAGLRPFWTRLCTPRMSQRAGAELIGGGACGTGWRGDTSPQLWVL